MKKVLFILALFSTPAFAQTCTVSPCTAVSPGEADFKAALPASGATGAFVVNVPSGTGTWTSGTGGTLNYTVPAGVTSLTIQGNTTVNCTGSAGTSSYACTATDNTNIVDSYNASGGSLLSINVGTAAFRMTGISFLGGTITSGNTKPNGFLLLSGTSSSVRIDHMHFNTNSYSIAQAGGGMTIFTNLYGVVDHSLFDLNGQNNGVRDYAGSADFGDANWAAATQLGTANFMYAENDVFNGGAANDCDEGGKVVVRYSTIIAVPSTGDTGLWQTHAMGQGQQRSRGCRAIEIYHNYILNPTPGTPQFTAGDCNSGTGVTWANTLSTGYSFDLACQQYREIATGHTQTAPPNGIGYCGNGSTGSTSAWDANSNPATGYPCIDQTGRGQGDLLNGLDFPSALNTATSSISWPHNLLEPWYIWNETNAGGSILTLPTYNDVQVVNNQDVFAPAGSFTGATGTGFGLLSARPATCTPGPGGTYGTGITGSPGVAYFATDANSGNGELYVCTATNTWTPYYQPYTYPHPLISGTVATPTFSPTPGNYGSAQTVTLATATGGATICYTTNGSNPTTNGAGTCLAGSSIYSVPFSVSSTATVKAIGTLSGDTDSSIASGTYTINGAAVAPTFSPVAGSYGPTQSVTISSATAGATICYTTDGSTPTADGAGTCTHGTTYSTAVSVSTSQTLKAIASKNGWNDSSVSSAAYVINGAASTPTFSPVAGAYGPTQNVAISASTSGATICYTTSGATPASSSPGVCAAGSTQYVSAVAVSSSLTLKAIATKSGFSDSSVGSAAYMINGAVNTPAFSPIAGIYTSTQNVTISTTTSGSSCFYTTDGSVPTPSSTPYTTPVVISSATTLRAICTKTGFSNSAVTSGTYTIATGCAIGFSPGAGSYTGTQNVTITTSGCTAGTQVFYRTDGLPATNIDTQYSSPIPVSSSQTLTAKAVINPTIRNQPQTISTQKKCNAVGSPITFPSGYSCTNGSGGVAGTASNFNFIAGSSNQMSVSTTDSVAFDTSILLIDTPTATDNNIVDQSFRKVYQDSSNCSQTSPNLYKCVDVSETDAESCCDATTHALWQMSVRCSTNAAGSSGNDGFLEGDASSGSEKWDIPCVIGAATDLTVNTHWALGDTGCGGSGCMVLDSIYLNGTEYDFPASCDSGDTHCPNYPMTPQPTYGNFIGGSQDQVYARNVGVAGTSPLTTTRSISFGRVGVDEGSEATGSAAYIITTPTAATPTFSPVAGTYVGTQSVTLSCSTSSPTMYYTTDGSTPTTSSTVYTTPITVSTSLTVKAICTASGYLNSSAGSAAYVITTPVIKVSISGNVKISGKAGVQ